MTQLRPGDRVASDGDTEYEVYNVDLRHGHVQIADTTGAVHIHPEDATVLLRATP